MIVKVFTASFTGVLSKLDNLSFKPPIRIEKGKRYELKVDPTNGATTWKEIEKP